MLLPRKALPSYCFRNTNLIVRMRSMTRQSKVADAIGRICCRRSRGKLLERDTCATASAKPPTIIGAGAQSQMEWSPPPEREKAQVLRGNVGETKYRSKAVQCILKTRSNSNDGAGFLVYAVQSGAFTSGNLGVHLGYFYTPTQPI